MATSHDKALKVIGKHKYWKATGKDSSDSYPLGYTSSPEKHRSSSPEKHRSESKKNGWKSEDLEYKAMHKLRRKS